VALLNRLEADKVSEEVERQMEEWQRRPQRIVAELIKNEVLNSPEAKHLNLLHLRQDSSPTTDHLYPQKGTEDSAGKLTSNCSPVNGRSSSPSDRVVS
jgi:hypothetical protein